MKTNYKKTPEPNYYVGTTYGYSARRVVEDFELSYNRHSSILFIKSR